MPDEVPPEIIERATICAFLRLLAEGAEEGGVYADGPAAAILHILHDKIAAGEHHECVRVEITSIEFLHGSGATVQ